MSCIYCILRLCALQKTSCRYSGYEPYYNQQNTVRLSRGKTLQLQRMCSFNGMSIIILSFITVQIYMSKLQLLKWKSKNKAEFGWLEMWLISGCVCWSWVNTLCLRIDFRVNKMFVPSGKLCWPKVWFTLFQLKLKIILRACCCSWKLIGKNIC